MKAKLFLSIVIVQLLIILFLGFTYLSKKNQKILGEEAFSPIEKEKLVFQETESLTRFYEPRENMIEKDNLGWLPEEATYTINADSLNERFDYSVEKPEGVFRLVTLGDSSTYGQYVNTQDNYPEQLEDLLNRQLSCGQIGKFEVINLGMGGYDIQYSVHRFKIRGIKYNPDLVLWFLKSDDFLLIYEKVIERIEEIEEKVNKTGRREEYIEKWGFYFSWAMAQEEFLEENGEDWILAHQEVFLTDFLQRYQGKVVLFTYSETKEKPKRMMESFANNRENVFFFDEMRLDDFDRLPDAHLSVEGYTTLANKLLSYLTEQEIIPCY